MHARARRTALCLAATSVLLLPGTLSAATFEIFPSSGSCDEEFENVANSLAPGDELILHGGVYAQDCQRLIRVSGTAADPVVIRAADGEDAVLTRAGTGQNNIEIDQSSYLVLRGLRFQGGSTGIRFRNGNHHVTIEDCEVHDTGNNAIAINNGSADSLTIRRNHIHHTGLGSGSTEGEGVYAGCNWDACRVTNSLFEGNYIHHLRGTSNGGNDGIEVKVGSHSNVIRNNVIHDTNIGTAYPCILVYGGGDAINIVEGNALWNCGEGVQVVSDAIVRNNVIFNSDIGILASSHAQVPQMRDVTIVHNTLYGHGQGLYIRWSGTTNMVFANNAVYSPGQTAINAGGLGGATVTVDANYVEGAMNGASVDGAAFHAGGSAASVFADPGGLDVWPTAGSPLIGAANATFAPLTDFNNGPRTDPFDVGAYETDGLAQNPGWQVGPGFKPEIVDDTPPSTPGGLNATPQSTSRIDLTWSAASDPDSGVSGYKVYRDDAVVGQTNSPAFSDTGLVEATSYDYAVSAVNGAGGESPKSTTVTATTLPDVTAPVIVSVEATAPTAVKVVFSEPVAQSSAANASNYGIDNGIAVSSAALGQDLVTVTLTTSALAEAVTYTLGVDSVTDRANQPNPIVPGTTATFQFVNLFVLDVRIGAAGDDVEESQDGTVDSSSSDLELVDHGGDLQTVGLRFDPVEIPQGSTILSAHIQFKVDETTSGTASLLVEAEASDDAAPFGNVTSRARASASTAWTPAAWDTVGEQGPDQRTPDITATIQEIVSRPGWTSGNALVLIVTGSGTRTAEAYDGDAVGAPLLHVEYSFGAAGNPPPPPDGLRVE